LGTIARQDTVNWKMAFFDFGKVTNLLDGLYIYYKVNLRQMKEKQR